MYRTGCFPDVLMFFLSLQAGDGNDQNWEVILDPHVIDHVSKSSYVQWSMLDAGRFSGPSPSAPTTATPPWFENQALRWSRWKNSECFCRRGLRSRVVLWHGGTATGWSRWESQRWSVRLEPRTHPGGNRPCLGHMGNTYIYIYIWGVCSAQK